MGQQNSQNNLNIKNSNSSKLESDENAKTKNKISKNIGSKSKVKFSSLLSNKNSEISLNKDVKVFNENKDMNFKLSLNGEKGIKKNKTDHFSDDDKRILGKNKSSEINTNIETLNSSHNDFIKFTNGEKKKSDQLESKEHKIILYNNECRNRKIVNDIPKEKEKKCYEENLLLLKKREELKNKIMPIYNDKLQSNFKNSKRLIFQRSYSVDSCRETLKLFELIKTKFNLKPGLIYNLSSQDKEIKKMFSGFFDQSKNSKNINSISKEINSSMISLNKLVFCPKIVPEKLDFKNLQKFEGHMLISWLTCSLKEVIAKHQDLIGRYLKIICMQFCNNLLAAGVMKKIEKNSSSNQLNFKLDQMYYWSHTDPMSPKKYTLFNSKETEKKKKRFEEGDKLKIHEKSKNKKDLVFESKINELVETFEENNQSFNLEIEKYKLTKRLNYDKQMVDKNSQTDETKSYKNESTQVPTPQLSSLFSIQIPTPPPLPSPFSIQVPTSTSLPSTSLTQVLSTLPFSTSFSTQVSTTTPLPFHHSIQIPTPPPFFSTQIHTPSSTTLVQTSTTFISPSSTQVSTLPQLLPLSSAKVPTPPPLSSLSSNQIPTPLPPSSFFSTQVPTPSSFPPHSSNHLPLLSLSSNPFLTPPSFTLPSSTHIPIPPSLPPLSSTQIPTAPPLHSFSKKNDKCVLNLSENSSFVKKNQMKPLYWKKICFSKNCIESTIWDSLKKINFDEEEFKKLFSKTQSLKKCHTVKINQNETKKIAKLLDQKRSQALGILISSLHLNVSNIETVLIDWELSSFNLDNLIAFYNQKPEKNEIELIKNYIENNGEGCLDKPEQFIYEISLIPSFEERIYCFIFQHSFSDKIVSIEQIIINFQSVLETLVSNSNIDSIFSMILTFGNYMNGGTLRGHAQAFSLEILSKLKDVKSQDNSCNLLEYIIKNYLYLVLSPFEIYDSFCFDKNLIMPLPDPNDLILAAQFNFENIKNDLEMLNLSVEDVNKKIEIILGSSDQQSIEPFKTKFSLFLKGVREKIKDEIVNLMETKNKFKFCLNYFYLTESEIEPKEFFQMWIPFCHDFKFIWKREIQKIIIKKKKEAKKLVLDLQENKKQNCSPTVVNAGGLKSLLKSKGIV